MGKPNPFPVGPLSFLFPSPKPAAQPSHLSSHAGPATPTAGTARVHPLPTRPTPSSPLSPAQPRVVRPDLPVPPASVARSAQLDAHGAPLPHPGPPASAHASLTTLARKSVVSPSSARKPSACPSVLFPPWTPAAPWTTRPCRTHGTVSRARSASRSFPTRARDRARWLRDPFPPRPAPPRSPARLRRARMPRPRSRL